MMKVECDHMCRDCSASFFYKSELSPYEMYASRKRVHRVFLHSRIIDADFRVRHAAAVPRLWVRFVLDHAVALCWTPCHGNNLVFRYTTGVPEGRLYA
jgi:hypothetical protein